MLSVVGLGLIALTLNGCWWRDCNAPYHDDYVFSATGDAALQNGETRMLAFTFYPEEPYKLGFADDVQHNPAIAVTAHGPFETIVIASRDLAFSEDESRRHLAIERREYSPDSPLNLSIEVSRNAVTESDMQISFEGYGSFVAPVSSEYLEVRLSLYPDIKCFGDSDDTVYLSQRVRIDLR